MDRRGRSEVITIIYDRDLEIQDNPAIVNLVLQLPIMQLFEALVHDDRPSGSLCARVECTEADVKKAYVCTRSKGHTKMHIATDGASPALAWED